MLTRRINDAEVDGSLNLRPAYYTQRFLRHSELYSETVSQNTTTTTTTTYYYY